ncbi:MAG: 1-acyl-sn-glycerol-3-phosphate acyltransferase [Bifidobacteriaceae bacterium]|nr:1-acyl-sn-glycerol-3-phosphate acyltransferase [Bifidobacteriaceae bacterium]
MFYWLTKAVASPLLRTIYRPWIKGAEHIPAKGPAILAGNHLAVFDSVFVPAVLNRRVFYIAKSDYFTGRGLKGRLTAGFMRGVGMIPVDRTGGKASLAALDKGREILEKGHLFGIYPEGTRSPDGRLYRGKTGAARLALETGAPVIPVAMIGTNLAQPAGQRLPSRVNMGMIFGQPMTFADYSGMSGQRAALREVTDQIMHRLMLLSGQEYVDVYAATMKARIASGASIPVSETPNAAPGGRQRPAGLEPPNSPADVDALYQMLSLLGPQKPQDAAGAAGPQWSDGSAGAAPSAADEQEKP